jgi:hypothetical protein
MIKMRDMLRIPKPEGRNPKEFRSSKTEVIFGMAALGSEFGIRASFGFRISGFGFIDGQFNCETAALANFTLDEHPPAVRFNNVFHDAQADADALRLAAQLGPQPVESLKDFLALGHGNAGTLVRDGQVDS